MYGVKCAGRNCRAHKIPLNHYMWCRMGPCQEFLLGNLWDLLIMVQVKLTVLELILPLYYCGPLEYLVHQYPDQNLEHLFEWYPTPL